MIETEKRSRRALGPQPGAPRRGTPSWRRPAGLRSSHDCLSEGGISSVRALRSTLRGRLRGTLRWTLRMTLQGSGSGRVNGWCGEK